MSPATRPASASSPPAARPPEADPSAPPDGLPADRAAPSSTDPTAPPSPSPSLAPTLAERWPDLSWPERQRALRDELRPAWGRLRSQVGLPKLMLGGVAILIVLGSLLLPTPAERADPFEGPGAALDLALKLGAVLALAYVSLAALRRYTGGATGRRGGLLEVLDSTTLAPNRAVYVVRVGRKRLVLGVTQQQITALGELPDEDDEGSGFRVLGSGGRGGTSSPQNPEPST